MKKIIVKFNTEKVYESLYLAIGELAKKIDIRNLITLIFNYTGTESIDEVVFNEIERVDPTIVFNFSPESLDAATVLLEILSEDIYEVVYGTIRDHNFSITLLEWISEDTATMELSNEIYH